MLIESLKLYNFRNLEDQTLAFCSGAHFIVGRNGQGKTNIVEAINLLSLGRSFRTSSLDDLIRWGAPACSVFARVNATAGSFDLGVAIEGESRKAYLDGDAVDFMGAFLGRLMCISFSPTDLALVKGAPQERRRFLDKHLVDLDPQLMPILVDYNKALRNKNALLKRGVSDPRMLDTWNVLLANTALKIHQARLEVLKALQEIAGEIYSRFSASDGALSLALKSSTFPADTPVTLEGALQRFEHVRDRELQFRASTIGPHRDDILIELGGNSARSFASQGQSRTIVLSLKLGVLELLERIRSEAPVILLDDVESELDSGRREALESLIRSHQSQIFVTGTSNPDSNLRAGREALELQIDGGKVSSRKLS